MRSLGVRGCDLALEANRQFSFLPEKQKEEKLDALERSVDGIRRRFGYTAVSRGIMLTDPLLSALNAKDDHVIHPVGFFK